MANVFDKALEIIRERGMCKHTQENRRGEVCLYGALSIAHCGVAIRMDTHHEIMDKVAIDLFPGRGRKGAGYVAADVNNHINTTQEDVELILKHSSYEYENQQMKDFLSDNKT